MSAYPVLKVGALAYWDSMSGPIPVKVLSISGPSGRPSSDQKVDFVVAADCRPYRKGERFTQWALHVVPRESIRHTKYSTTIGYYNVEA